MNNFTRRSELSECLNSCMPTTCTACDTKREQIALESSSRRRNAWIATRGLARALFALGVCSVDFVKATASWLYWESRH